MIDIELPVDCARAAETDDVANTVDYKRVAKRIIAFVEASEFKLVETLAHKTAMLIIEEFHIAWLKHLRSTSRARSAARATSASRSSAPAPTCRATWRAESMPRVFVAAGSNVDPERNLAKAAAELAREFPDIEFSPWYRNKAVGFDGADFINFVVGFSTELPVHDVVAKLRAIEALCGRPPGAPEVRAALDGSRHPFIRRSGSR